VLLNRGGTSRGKTKMAEGSSWGIQARRGGSGRRARGVGAPASNIVPKMTEPGSCYGSHVARSGREKKEGGVPLGELTCGAQL
jgi:hypothetical protein